MTLYLAHDGAVLLLVALVVGILHTTENICLHALNFAVGEAIFGCRKHYAKSCIEAFLPLILAENNVKFEALLGLAYDVLAKLGTSLHEWCIGFLCKLGQTLVEGHGDDVLKDAGHIADLRKLDSIGQWVGLVHDSKDVVVLLGVTGYSHQGFLVVLNWEIYAFCFILGVMDIRPKSLNLLLHSIDINISDNENTLQVGTIPLVIVVTQFVVGEIVNHRHQADRHTLGITIAGDKLRKDGFVHTESGTCSSTPLLMNHTTLLVNLITIEC